MKLYVDGKASSLASFDQASVQQLRELTARLLGSSANLFAEVHRFRGSATASVGVSTGGWPLVREVCEDTPSAALRAGCGALVEALETTPARTLDGDVAQVSEVLLQACRFPLGDVPATREDFDRILEERFVYHLDDGTALKRAGLSNSPCFAYAAKGSHEIRALVSFEGRWFRIDDIDRLGWLALHQGSLDIELIGLHQVGSSVNLCSEMIFEAPDLPGACTALSKSAYPFVYARIDSLAKSLLLVRDGNGLVRAYTYEIDAWKIHPQTGPFGTPMWALDDIPAAPPKQERLVAILACPHCLTPVSSFVNATYNCPKCGTNACFIEGTYDFVPGGAERRFKDPDASRNTHSKQLVHDLRLFSKGLILNAGSGDTLLQEPNLVNLEIVRYENIDVAGDGQKLPFVDNAFDMVFSQSVVEHTPDPFSHARELKRVLKPGGRILVDAPFLSPFHGYPNHYFNPTMNGLRQLMDGVEEIGLREGPHHAPAQAVFSIMSHWVHSLRMDDARQKLLSMSVGEFLSALQASQCPEVTADLRRDQTYVISAGFAFYGRKSKADHHE